MPYRKKLIEVSLPLEAINKESAREKSIRHGHPSTLHLWWARRPLAACRAVLFSSLVDDPSEYMPDEESAIAERERLFALIEELVKWENIQNEELFDKARLEIARSVARDLGCDVPVGKEAIRKFLAEKAPPVLDPFAGGGSIPLEAQRLGLRTYASDLNPVAVLINKALIEIPPKFAGMPPVHPPEEGNEGKGEKGKQASLWKKEWKGAEGLAEDVRYYGKWMRDEAQKRIGHLYPKYKISAELLAEREDLRKQGIKPSDELTVIAWLWARTVKCPNPACGSDMPLVSSLELSTKSDRHTWIEPIIDNASHPKKINFVVKTGKGSPPPPPKLGRGAQFRCLACGQISSEVNIRNTFRDKKDGTQLLAIVAETSGRRIYIPPEDIHNSVAFSANPPYIPEEEMNIDTPNLVSGRGYGITKWKELFTLRQLTLLSVLSELVVETRNKVLYDTNNLNTWQFISGDEYANAITTYIGLGVSKLSDYNSSFVLWSPGRDQAKSTFARQALPMVWDFCEVNPFAQAAGDLIVTLTGICDVLKRLSLSTQGKSSQRDATSLSLGSEKYIFSTDPPYYDNIAYADLADYFYIWLRRSVSKIYPDLFATVLVPKTTELVAASYRFNGDTNKAKEFFESGLQKVFRSLCANTKENIPITIYYAFKQAENEDENHYSSKSMIHVSTGWETMLQSLLNSGFQINGTWPIRTERSSRTISIGTNALASSIILVCRPRLDGNPYITRREFLASLKRELPSSLKRLQQGNIAPVDLAQAAIGPGMAIFSCYSQVLEADGSSMRVRAALALINQSLDEYLAEQEGEYDADTRWAMAWFEQYGHEQGHYGVAETLSKAKNTSVEGLAQAGFLEARGGKVRLLRRDELKPDYDPAKDKRPTSWEAAQYLIKSLDKDGEAGAGVLLSKLGGLGETARDLAYRLYTICERKGWAQEALAYNMLVVAWPRIKEQAGKQARQEKLF